MKKGRPVLTPAKHLEHFLHRVADSTLDVQTEVAQDLEKEQIWITAKEIRSREFLRRPPSIPPGLDLKQVTTRISNKYNKRKSRKLTNGSCERSYAFSESTTISIATLCKKQKKTQAQLLAHLVERAEAELKLFEQKEKAEIKNLKEKLNNTLRALRETWLQTYDIAWELGEYRASLEQTPDPDPKDLLRHTNDQYWALIRAIQTKSVTARLLRILPEPPDYYADKLKSLSYDTGAGPPPSAQIKDVPLVMRTPIRGKSHKVSIVTVPNTREKP